MKNSRASDKRKPNQSHKPTRRTVRSGRHIREREHRQRQRSPSPLTLRAETPPAPTESPPPPSPRPFGGSPRFSLPLSLEDAVYLSKILVEIATATTGNALCRIFETGVGFAIEVSAHYPH